MKTHRVRVLHKLSHHLPVLVLHDEHFLRLRHPIDHYAAHLGQRVRVDGTPRRGIRGAEHGGDWRLLIQIGGQGVPVLEADLEYLHVLHLGDHNEIREGLLEPGRLLLHEAAVLLQEDAQEHGQVLNKVLLVVRAVLVDVAHVHLRIDDLVNLLHRLREQLHERLAVVGHNKAGDFRQALERHIAKHGHGEELADQQVDELRLEDVAVRDPVHEAQQGVQRGGDQGRVHRVL